MIRMGFDTDIMEIRRRNLRTLIAQWGSPTALAKKLKLSGPSYLSQMVGGHRPLTEKTARKLEQQLGLKVGWLDETQAAGDRAASVDDTLIARVVMVVGETLKEAGVTVAPDKFAELVTLVYGEASRTGAIDEKLVQRLVQLMR